MKIRVSNRAVKKESRDDTYVYAEQEKLTKRQIRFRIAENKYGFTGSIYFPKEHLKGNSPPERLKMKIVFDRD